jgi:glutathione S-transferase
MKLFYAPQSPFSRKVRAAAIELGFELELEYAEAVPGKPNPAYARANPLRKIPALVTDDGAILYDSTVICEYLDARAGGGILFPREPAARWRVLTHHALAQGMCDSAVLLRYETWLRPEAQRWPVWIDEHWSKIGAGLAWFEENGGALRAPLNIAHLALASLVGYIDFRWPDRDRRRQFPAVYRWFEEIEARPSLRQTRPSNPPT